MSTLILFSLSLLALLGRASASLEDSALSVPATRVAVAKALPLLLKSAQGHTAKRTCFACHNQGVPMLAFVAAREHGFALESDAIKKQLGFVASFLERNQEQYRKGQGQGGQVDTAGSALLTLERGGWQKDATTEAVVEYLLLRDKERDHWRAVSQRPPSEASHFTATYVALRALRHWGTPAQKDKIEQRIEMVRGWLLKTPAKDTEDRVSRLRALREIGAVAKEQRNAVQELLGAQRPDGGWAQTEKMDSDAYATGSVLVALHETGALQTGDPVYQRGVAFLLKSQRADGSWLVRSRSKPFQTYFETGFPHGKDQFISAAATGWATTALALACAPAKAGGQPER
jgi:hypothetical protein